MNSTTRPEPRRTAAKRDVVKLARDRSVRFVRLVFADIFGVSKNVSIPIDQLEAALDGRVTFDGGSIDGFVRGEELDMVLQPDPSTFAVYPWRAAPDAAEARLICDIAMPNGSPFEGCPRTTLRRAIESAGALRGERIGLEIEFYLFEQRGGDGTSTATSDVGSYFDFSANDRGEEARNAIVAALREMGVPISSAHHEHGAGQHEIDV
ncbi:MAG: glutamine synthetase beta-grasp domain-containing protein, partial [Candidatus Eremiobacteraeota bacterium]|nr:glutamine synthetase beta-grasp domain-containing protein [Candidatus Eremiobacteraeota bacterium]